jgi:ribose 5-phosphate isomerase B
MKIYIGADHRGFDLKDEIKSWLKDRDVEVSDLGAYKFDEHDDYPQFAEKVGFMVASEDDSRGILICGSGVGVDVVANKIDGIRSSIGKEKAQVIAGRKDDDMNVLVIAADFTSLKESQEMVKAFLETEFVASEPHTRRLAEIERLEENN